MECGEADADADERGALLIQQLQILQQAMLHSAQDASTARIGQCRSWLISIVVKQGFSSVLEGVSGW